MTTTTSERLHFQPDQGAATVSTTSQEISPSTSAPLSSLRKPRLLRLLLARDTSWLARRWWGKVLVAVALVGIPTVMLLRSLQSGRYPDTSWLALLMGVVLGVGYTVSRRLLLTILASVLVVVSATWALAPRPTASPSGDSAVVAALNGASAANLFDHQRDVSVALVSLDGAHAAQFGGRGAAPTTRAEVGSLTKAMTGLVIADEVDRGELRMDVPVSTYLPELAGSPAGTVTMNELVTHSAGFGQFGPSAMRRAVLSAPLGRNFLAADLDELYRDARSETLRTRGHYSYSNLGAAIAGQAAAAAAGMSYSELMTRRLFEPLGLDDTAIQGAHPMVAGGTAKSGLPVQPWILGAYAPAGGVVSTTRDLAKLATALLNGTAPGMSALHAFAPTSQADTRVGIFWHTTTGPSGTAITWHGGQTGGYTTYFGLDRAGRPCLSGPLGCREPRDRPARGVPPRREELTKPVVCPVVGSDGFSDGFRLVLPRPGLPPQLTLLANHPQHSAKRGLVLWVVRKCRRQARTEQNSERGRREGEEVWVEAG